MGETKKRDSLHLIDGRDERGFTLQTVILSALIALGAVGAGVVAFNVVSTDETTDIVEVRTQVAVKQEPEPEAVEQAPEPEAVEQAPEPEAETPEPVQEEAPEPEPVQEPEPEAETPEPEAVKPDPVESEPVQKQEPQQSQTYIPQPRSYPQPAPQKQAPKPEAETPEPVQEQSPEPDPVESEPVQEQAPAPESEAVEPEPEIAPEPETANQGFTTLRVGPYRANVGWLTGRFDPTKGPNDPTNTGGMALDSTQANRILSCIETYATLASRDGGLTEADITGENIFSRYVANGGSFEVVKYTSSGTQSDLRFTRWNYVWNNNLSEMNKMRYAFIKCLWLEFPQNPNLQDGLDTWAGSLWDKYTPKPNGIRVECQTMGDALVCRVIED